MTVESSASRSYIYLQIMLGLKIVLVSHFHRINTDLSLGTMLSFLLLPIG